MPTVTTKRELLELDRMQARIEVLKEYLATSQARKLVSLIKKAGWYKGEILDLTPSQFRKVLGYPPRKSIIRKGKVPWEFCFDQLATELGYRSDHDLKVAVEDARKKMHELEDLQAKWRNLKPAKKKVKSRTAIQFESAPLVYDGLVHGKSIEVGGKRIGMLVQHPSYWTTHISDDHHITKRALEAPLAKTRYAKDAEKEARRMFSPGRKRKAKKKKKGGS